MAHPGHAQILDVEHLYIQVKMEEMSGRYQSKTGWATGHQLTRWSVSRDENSSETAKTGRGRPRADRGCRHPLEVTGR